MQGTRPGDQGPARLSRAFTSRLAVLTSTLDGGLGISHSLELFDALLAFHELWEQGEWASAREITDYLQDQHGWTPTAATQLAYTWWIFAGLRVFDRAMEGRETAVEEPEPKVLRAAA